MSSDVASPARRDAAPGRADAAPGARTAGGAETPGDLAPQGGPGDDDGDGGTGVTCRLEELLAERQMTMTELSRRTGITMANLSILKNNKAKAIRMTTIATLCRALRVTPGQLLTLDSGSA